MSTDNKLNGRCILVSGASSGIGRAVSESLLAQGARVVGVARDFSKWPQPPDDFSPFELDLADLKKLPAALKEISRLYPQIDGLVHAAGRGLFGSLEEFSYTQIDAIMNLNFNSHAYVSRHFLPLFKRQGRGDLVFIGSEAALSGGRRGAIYCASKFALRGFAQALREECAKSGVRVGVVNPGMVKTAFFDELSFRHGAAEENYLRPTDVAEAVSLMLCAHPGSVIDEINLSPLKTVLEFTPGDRKG